MLKVIILLVLLATFITGAFLYFKKPSLPFPIPFVKSENLTKDQEKDKPDILSTTYNNLINTTTKSVDEAREKVHQTAQNALDNAFDKKSSPPAVSVSVTITNEASPADEKLSVDLTSSGNLKLNLQKGKQYFLEFKNIQPDKCLFINSSKYELKDGSGIKISFSDSGVYKIKTGPCATLEKEIGELVVN